MRYELLVVMNVNDARRMAQVGKIANQKVHIVEAFGMAAILRPVSYLAKFKKSNRKNLIKKLGSHQELLEAFLRYGPVVCVSGDVRVRDEADALGILVTHQELFNSALKTFGQKVQFQITITLNQEAYFKSIADQPAMVEALNMEPSARPGALTALFNTKKAEIEDKAIEYLQAASEDTLTMPKDDDAVILNIAVLIESHLEIALDRAVEAIDELASDIVNIRYLGPLPALSFGSVELTKLNEKAIAKARDTFDAGDGLAVATLKKRYHDLMRANHPDLCDAEDADATSAEITQDYKLLMSLASLVQKGGSVDLPVLAELTSDKDRRAA